MQATLETNVIHCGDARAVLKTLPSESVHCIITSPPYYGLRDYGVDGQIGQEETLEDYISSIVSVFREARRVLRDDGTLWLNLGDCYAGAGHRPAGKGNEHGQMRAEKMPDIAGLKPKDMVGLPWRVAFALQADGWWLRSDIVWHKPNALPENVRDRPTKAHEYVFLLAKSRRYYYDADAVREPYAVLASAQNRRDAGRGNQEYAGASGMEGHRPAGRNRRTVWSINTQAKPFRHFAMFPFALVEPMILAGSPEGGIVLDPFIGSGTTAIVAERLNRQYIGIELNPEYVALAKKRIRYKGDDRRMVRDDTAGTEQLSLTGGENINDNREENDNERD